MIVFTVVDFNRHYSNFPIFKDFFRLCNEFT
jgi:hypothetical protein